MSDNNNNNGRRKSKRIGSDDNRENTQAGSKRRRAPDQDVEEETSPKIQRKEAGDVGEQRESSRRVQRGGERSKGKRRRSPSQSVDEPNPKSQKLSLAERWRQRALANKPSQGNQSARVVDVTGYDDLVCRDLEFDADGTLMVTEKNAKIIYKAFGTRYCRGTMPKNMLEGDIDVLGPRSLCCFEDGGEYDYEVSEENLKLPLITSLNPCGWTLKFDFEEQKYLPYEEKNRIRDTSNVERLVAIKDISVLSVLEEMAIEFDWYDGDGKAYRDAWTNLFVLLFEAKHKEELVLFRESFVEPNFSVRKMVLDMNREIQATFEDEETAGKRKKTVGIKTWLMTVSFNKTVRGLMEDPDLKDTTLNEDKFIETLKRKLIRVITTIGEGNNAVMMDFHGGNAHYMTLDNLVKVSVKSCEPELRTDGTLHFHLVYQILYLSMENQWMFLRYKTFTKAIQNNIFPGAYFDGQIDKNRDATDYVEKGLVTNQ